MSKRITWAIPVTTQESSTSIQGLFICLKHTPVSEHQSKPLPCPLALTCDPQPRVLSLSLSLMNVSARYMEARLGRTQPDTREGRRVVSRVRQALDEAASYSELAAAWSETRQGEAAGGGPRQSGAPTNRRATESTRPRPGGGVCACGSPLRLEELQQHRVGVEPLSDRLGYLGGAESGASIRGAD